MNIELIIILTAVILILLALGIYKFSKTNSKQKEMKIESPIATIEKFTNNFELIDSNGEAVLSINEIDYLPNSSFLLKPSESIINHTKHLTSELIKSSVTLPNKTLQVIFKKHIEDGLADGSLTMMQTKSGEVLADVVDSSGKIAGKGRLVEGGKVKQLAAGAFQLISIAVAQSHLADIEQSLRKINQSINDILKNLEQEDRSKITGAIDYLTQIAQHMMLLKAPDEISEQKTIIIESIIYESNAWRNKLHSELEYLINNIKSHGDQDSFGGTENTYNSLYQLVDKIQPLIERNDLLLSLSLLTNIITSYIDPKNKTFSLIDTGSEKWQKLTADFKNCAIKKSEELLSNAIFNSGSTLKTRRDNIELITKNHYNTLSNQFNSHIQSINTLKNNVQRLTNKNNNLNLALTFDNKGELCETAIV